MYRSRYKFKCYSSHDEADFIRSENSSQCSFRSHLLFAVLVSVSASVRRYHVHRKSKFNDRISIENALCLCRQWNFQWTFQKFQISRDKCCFVIRWCAPLLTYARAFYQMIRESRRPFHFSTAKRNYSKPQWRSSQPSSFRCHHQSVIKNFVLLIAHFARVAMEKHFAAHHPDDRKNANENESKEFFSLPHFACAFFEYFLLLLRWWPISWARENMNEKMLATRWKINSNAEDVFKMKFSFVAYVACLFLRAASSSSTVAFMVTKYHILCTQEWNDTHKKQRKNVIFIKMVFECDKQTQTSSTFFYFKFETFMCFRPKKGKTR